MKRGFDMKKIYFCTLTLLLAAALLLSGCGEKPDGNTDGNVSDLGGSDESFGEDYSDEIYDGYFEDSVANIEVNCISGTPNAYKLEGNTLTFTAIAEDSVYSISGQLKGNIVIDVGDGYKFDLEMHGLSLVSDSINPITILSGDEVSLTAKKDTENYVYDMREAVDDADETLYSGAIYSLVDVEICGKGKLTVVSENNNGIHTKDDLQVKNLTLFVTCVDNALKGNDSVELESGTTTLIATKGDGIKTTNSDISEKGNQRGSVTVSGGEHPIYAACDGIDAAYDVTVDGETTVLNIYTDKYSNYSEEVTAVDGDSYYIRFTTKSYRYSIKYYNSDDDYIWVNPEYHSSVSGGRTTYYYYSFPKLDGYSKLQFFIYNSDMEQGQEGDCIVRSDYLEINTAYDTLALSTQGSYLYYTWTNYTTRVQDNGMGRPGGMGGGMQEGNSDKGDHSTKGIKAANEIVVNSGTVNIKAYDDAIHANGDTSLENGASPLGNVTVNGGNLTLYSNDDGIHADGALTVTNGNVSIAHSYEGLEGAYVKIAGGNVSVLSSDDGVNATTTSGTAIEISGGELYVYCSGDGLDSNSRTSYSGIIFSGGNTVVISNSNGNSAIDSEAGYAYTGGSVVAIMPGGGGGMGGMGGVSMTGETTNCQNFSSVATKKTLSLSSGEYLIVKVDGDAVVTLKMPTSISSAMVVYIGSPSASCATDSSSSAELDRNGVCWE